MAELGERQGVIGESEANILRNLLRFDSVLAEHVMTPRTVVVAADESTSIRAFHDSHPDLRFSRIPVHAGALDHLTGYVLKDDILKRIVDGDGDKPLAEIRRDVTAVSESFPIPKLFHHFIDTREHLAAVIDEFGGLAGIVTMEDVIETLLGMEIVDEQDGTVDMQALAREQWERRARRLGLLEPGEEIGLSQTSEGVHTIDQAEE
jgi:CBS domain containing-hemolysin-like protein